MALITSHVGFFLALHPLHEERLKEACWKGMKNWYPHIKIHMENFVETELIRMLRNEVKSCDGSGKLGPLMIFLKRWFEYNKTKQGDFIHKYRHIQ